MKIATLFLPLGVLAGVLSRPLVAQTQAPQPVAREPNGVEYDLTLRLRIPTRPEVATEIFRNKRANRSKESAVPVGRIESRAQEN